MGGALSQEPKDGRTSRRGSVYNTVSPWTAAFRKCLPCLPCLRGIKDKKLLRRVHIWSRSLVLRDPRRQILEYFRPGDSRGPLGYLQSQGLRVNANEDASHFFAIWRPTSMIALGMMMEGKATGKGLNIKGKSAKGGTLSGFVPFLQISEEKDKHRLGTSPPDGRTQMYYQSARQREAALAFLRPVLNEMDSGSKAASQALREWKGEASRRRAQVVWVGTALGRAGCVFFLCWLCSGAPVRLVPVALVCRVGLRQSRGVCSDSRGGGGGGAA